MNDQLYFLIFDSEVMNENTMFDTMGFSDKETLKEYLKDMGDDDDINYEIFSAPRGSSFLVQVKSETIVKGLD